MKNQIKTLTKTKHSNENQASKIVSMRFPVNVEENI